MSAILKSSGKEFISDRHSPLISAVPALISHYWIIRGSDSLLIQRWVREEPEWKGGHFGMGLPDFSRLTRVTKSRRRHARRFQPFKPNRISWWVWYPRENAMISSWFSIHFSPSIQLAFDRFAGISSDFRSRSHYDENHRSFVWWYSVECFENSGDMGLFTTFFSPLWVESLTKPEQKVYTAVSAPTVTKSLRLKAFKFISWIWLFNSRILRLWWNDWKTFVELVDAY